MYNVEWTIKLLKTKQNKKQLKSQLIQMSASVTWSCKIYIKMLNVKLVSKSNFIK